ncbi:trichohyalin-like [Spea bombifrons]|uniref:trichohyalin-like n=1 Tax=Spea bombifrons TaxID=233779 RepID=UPI0023497F3A|nr:trichohyalin-like [Spea bombifrons]
MTDVPIDKSSLPRVNEVCRDFAVLEDGALAHCLQEQEIEQHYASNIRKNKLVQKDIRIAKKLQDEEDLQCKVFSLEKQKQIEELDSEYARAVQEELQRKAAECLQREEEDKEIAKRLQQLEEEELQRKKQDMSRGEHGNLQQPYLTPLENEEEEDYLFRNNSKKSVNTPDYRRVQRSSEREQSSRHSEEELGRVHSAHKGHSNRVSFGQIHYESNSCKNDKASDVWKEPSRREHVQVPYRNPRSSLERSPCHPSRVEVKHDREIIRKEETVRVQREKHCKHYPERCRRSSSDSDDCTDQCVRDRRSRRSQWNQSRDRHHHRPLNKPHSRKSSHILRSDEDPKTSFDINPLDWKMAELHVQSSDQLLQDEELARQLQEEEEKRIAKLKQREQHEDFRAAQVAQDEEIAKYIQRQELEARRRSEELDLNQESDDDISICSFSERRSLGVKNEVPPCNQGRLDSEGLASPTECRTPERMEVSTAEGLHDQTNLRSPRNIAEELDPTFKSKKESTSDVFADCSQEFPVTGQTQAVPVDGLYELMDDGANPLFIPPTKRQPEKLGRTKPKDKKEGCKQQ